MIKYYIYFLCLWSSSVLLSQSIDTSFINTGPHGYGKDNIQSGMNHDINNKKIDYSLQMGTQITKTRNQGNVNLYYVSPRINYSLNNKFDVSVGATMFQNNSSFLYLPFEKSSNALNKSQYISLYAEGEYRFNKKIHMRGSVYRLFDDKSAMNPYMINQLSEHVSFGIYYNITKNLNIGAEFRMQKVDNPYYMPYYNHSSYPGPYDFFNTSF